MSEPILPCPKCGAPGVSEDYLFVGCSDIDCTLPEMMMQDWNRLSRAAALLRAVEGLDAYHHEHWQHAIEIEVMQNETIGIYVQPGKLSRGATLADALIALAGEVAK